MRFIYEPRGDATVMHIERHNAIGESLWRPLCRRKLEHPRSVNLPLGQPICDDCLKMANPTPEPSDA